MGATFDVGFTDEAGGGHGLDARRIHPHPPARFIPDLVMNRILDCVRSAIDKLMKKSLPELYVELGNRLKAMENKPSSAGEFDAVCQQGLGESEELREFGQRFFQRTSRQIFELLCGTGQATQKDRELIVDAFDSGAVAVGPALATSLVSYLGWAPAVATVAAAIAVKVFFDPKRALGRLHIEQARSINQALRITSAKIGPQHVGYGALALCQS